MRRLVTSICLVLGAVCGFGLLGTLEPMEAGARTTWRVVCCGGLLATIGGLVWVVRSGCGTGG